jgi:hypothetical protein
MITKLLILLLTLVLIPSASANTAVNLDIQSIDISVSSTKGGNQRGAALAVLQDGSLLLGGGKSGGEIFTYNIASKSLKKITSLIPANRRTNDSRFAINDIGVLSQSSTAVKFLVSYPRLGSERNCVEVVVEQLDLNRVTQKVKRGGNWLITKPCVPISAVQHTSGRFEVIDQSSAYLTIGDLGYPQISDRKKRGDLGSIVKVSAKGAVKISQGHRNAQGIVLFNNKDLLAAEHGPRGGDEINLIKPGADYGWPFVTYGQPYGAGDYVRPSKTGTHVGYVQPLTYWVPSIAPTELVQLPKDGWGQWSNQLLLGTLREQSLVFLKLDQSLAVVEQEIVDVGERIRDLELLPNGVAVATTDSGQLLLISLAK